MAVEKRRKGNNDIKSGVWDIDNYNSYHVLHSKSSKRKSFNRYN